MKKEKCDLREELCAYKFEFDLMQKIACSKEENKKYEKILKDGGTLPEGVFPCYTYDNGEPLTSEFYTIYEPDLTESEITEYLTYKKLDMIRTIKNCILFFTSLTVIGMIVWLFVAFGSM